MALFEKIINCLLIIIIVALNCHFSTVFALDCTDISGTTTTITKNCSDLDIDGDSSNVTINSGVTIDGAGWDYYISSYQRWSGVIQYQELPYQAMTESNIYIYYTMGV